MLFDITYIINLLQGPERRLHHHVVSVLSVRRLNDRQFRIAETPESAPDYVAAPGLHGYPLRVREGEDSYVLESQAGGDGWGMSTGGLPHAEPAVGPPVAQAVLARVAQQARLPSVPFHPHDVFRVQQVEVGAALAAAVGARDEDVQVRPVHPLQFLDQFVHCHICLLHLARSGAPLCQPEMSNP